MSLRTMTPSRWLLSGLLLASVGTTLIAEDAPVDDEKARKAKRYADVVMRLTDTDLTADAKTKAMVEKALTANEGLPAYVEIIRDDLQLATELELANACERVARADGRLRIVECIDTGRGGPGAR